MFNKTFAFIAVCTGLWAVAGSADEPLVHPAYCDKPQADQKRFVKHKVTNRLAYRFPGNDYKLISDDAAALIRECGASVFDTYGVGSIVGEEWPDEEVGLEHVKTDFLYSEVVKRLVPGYGSEEALQDTYCTMLTLDGYVYEGMSPYLQNAVEERASRRLIDHGFNIWGEDEEFQYQALIRAETASPEERKSDFLSCAQLYAMPLD